MPVVEDTAGRRCAGRARAGRAGVGYAGDGCASFLFQLSYHGTGRTDAQAVPPCQAGLQRMSRSGGVAVEVAL